MSPGKPHLQTVVFLTLLALTLSAVLWNGNRLGLPLGVVHAETDKPTADPNKPAVEPIEVKVLVLNFDPKVSFKNNRRLHEVCGWQNPRGLAKGYIADVKKASHGIINYRIVEWRDIEAFPPKTDGFAYTVESYFAAREGKQPWHEPDSTDYPKVIADYGLAEAIDSGKADEIWWFGGPYFGFWESAMAGPGAFFINGGVYDKVRADRPFVIMGFNYERGVAEMLHDLCHRTEATMARISGGWAVDKLTTPWAKFAANLHQSGTAAVGTCHFPPNAEKGYDYGNPRTVESSAVDWAHYPDLRGRTAPVSRETWGGPDYHRNYMVWWFSHIPHAPGRDDDGRLHNWWAYIFEFWKYTDRGLPLPTDDKQPAPAGERL